MLLFGDQHALRWLSSLVVAVHFASDLLLSEAHGLRLVSVQQPTAEVCLHVELLQSNEAVVAEAYLPFELSSGLVLSWPILLVVICLCLQDEHLTLLAWLCLHVRPVLS